VSSEVAPSAFEQSSGDAGDIDIDVANVLRGEHPQHRIRQLETVDEVRAVLDHETEVEPRKDVVAACNRRIDTLRENDRDKSEIRYGAPSLDEAREIAALFGPREVCDQLRRERARDEPRETVLQACEERLEEVSKP